MIEKTPMTKGETTRISAAAIAIVDTIKNEGFTPSEALSVLVAAIVYVNLRATRKEHLADIVARAITWRPTRPMTDTEAKFSLLVGAVLATVLATVGFVTGIMQFYGMGCFLLGAFSMAFWILVTL